MIFILFWLDDDDDDDDDDGNDDDGNDDTFWRLPGAACRDQLTNHDTNLQYPPIMTVPVHPLVQIQFTELN